MNNQMEFLRNLKLNKARDRVRTETSLQWKPFITFSHPSTSHQHVTDARLERSMEKIAAAAQVKMRKVIKELEEILRQQEDLVNSRRERVDEMSKRLLASIMKLLKLEKAGDLCRKQLKAFQEETREIKKKFKELALRFAAMSAHRSDLIDRIALMDHEVNITVEKLLENAQEPSRKRFALADPGSEAHRSSKANEELLVEEERHKQAMDELSKKAADLDAQDAETLAQLEKATEQHDETFKENLMLDTNLEVTDCELKKVLADTEESKNLFKELEKHLLISQRDCEKELGKRQCQLEEKKDQLGLLSKKEAMQSELEAVKQDVTEQRAKQEKLCSLLSESQARGQKVNDELEELQEARLALKRQLEFAETKYHQSEAQLSDLMRSVKDLLLEKGHSDALPVIKELLERSASTLKALKQHLQDRDATVTSINHKQKAIKKEHHQMNADYENQQLEFHKLFETYSEEEYRKQAVDKEVQNLRQKAEQKKKETEKIDNYRKNIEDTRAEQEKLKLLIDQLLERKTEALQEKQNELELVEELKEKLRQLNKEQQEEADKNGLQGEAEERHTRVEEEIRDLENEIKAARKEVKVAEKAAKELKAKRAVGQIEDSDPELVELDERLMELNMELEHVRNQVLEAEARVAKGQKGDQKSSPGKEPQSKLGRKNSGRAELKGKENDDARRTRTEKSSDTVAPGKAQPTVDVTVVDLTEDEPGAQRKPQTPKTSRKRVDDASQISLDHYPLGSPGSPFNEDTFKKPLPLAAAPGPDYPARYRRTYTRKKHNTADLDE